MITVKSSTFLDLKKAPHVVAAEENRRLFQAEELKSNGAKFGRSAAKGIIRIGPIVSE